MSPVGLAVLVVVGVVAFWFLGGVIFRFSGWLCVVGGAAGLASGSGAGTIGIVVLGCVIWLFGHRLYALRNGGYKSRLAARVLNRPEPSGRVRDR